jgi:hypothetical protein
MDKRELRYFKAYCQWLAYRRFTRPAPSAYLIDRWQAMEIRQFAEGLLSDYHDRRCDGYRRDT